MQLAECDWQLNDQNAALLSVKTALEYGTSAGFWEATIPVYMKIVKECNPEPCDIQKTLERVSERSSESR